MQVDNCSNAWLKSSDDGDKIFIQPFRLSFWDGSELLRKFPDLLVRQLLTYCYENNTRIPSCTKGAWGKNDSLRQNGGKLSRWVAGRDDSVVDVSRFRYIATGAKKRQLVIAQDRSGRFNSGQPGIVVSLKCRYRFLDHDKNVRRSRWVLWTPHGLEERCFIERLTALSGEEHDQQLRGSLPETKLAPFGWCEGMSHVNIKGAEEGFRFNMNESKNQRASRVSDRKENAIVSLVIKGRLEDDTPFRTSFSKCDSIRKLFAFAVREHKIKTATLMMEVKIGTMEPIIIVRDDPEDFDKILAQIKVMDSEEYLEVVAMPLNFD